MVHRPQPVQRSKFTWHFPVSELRESAGQPIRKHAPQAVHEKLFRFEFPERPGALLDVRKGLTRGWNISLFHYRNHGAAYGRVLVGVQLKRSAAQEFRSYMESSGYAYSEETDNPAYRLFASGG